MIKKVFKKVFGSKNERTIRKMRKTVEQINALEDEFHLLSDEKLLGKTAEFRSRVESGTSLDELLPEAFATVREASQRVFQMRHYDEQLIGGMVLHQGKIVAQNINRSFCHIFYFLFRYIYQSSYYLCKIEHLVGQ